MLELKNVTAIFIDGVGNDTEQIYQIIVKTNLKIKFNSIFHFSVNPITNINYVTPFKINPTTYGEFNNFCLKNIYPFLITDYSIWMQPDGFILNPHLWDDNFYNYDYIGSPWPWFPKHVGNGGFSFRSKKLLHLATKLPYIERNEDAVICDLHRQHFTSNGCKYPDLDLGVKWGLEESITDKKNDLNFSFGFHGKKHLEEAKKIFEKNFKDTL
jgi:hypothetical protein